MSAKFILAAALLALSRGTETLKRVSFDPVADPKMNTILAKIEHDIHDLSNTESVPAIPQDSFDIPASLLEEKDGNGVDLEQTLQGLDTVANNQQKLLQDTTSQLTDIQHHLDSLLTVHT
ncbi:hypothetical protein Pmar_PMAR008679 [Perkinsus marinus ATCC 50983]|uniref:Uncharacterized protein n=1 Tax=Perkinsus marinus (strain ATCC 50983 / TXsc) TaxID=423536 RepID=C5KQD9_PERM5|nr:hypothetical protein Pmar_PMAR005020 [Perkinsus marinus ATCC 50983]XP_002776348.1 hypothetical protein Pmar_PMAR014927 [Perkinsus marinus ATCC 50983]XP_002781509.1 hypothetical protein Pmar_PMAR008679 [Perkinsus marinus ATCC 50983]EER04464.1 hypothetical protein Pmar_PMAR005020 [Perkinsus marinus ATCC 50983]EER08164.1 hypothetical protein Pmar_PMAR014927 [Perkinsus marinus ATCC 50983]EER13304.1 hypothetical protein Pmar_PMAR008679 [Perkinsus marinus ATCC 50983]|eukprot:XP_002772648.1 hypothetical protein Pmar_PMAR005020 [Perkinsus marinus ATCC 50983]